MAKIKINKKENKIVVYVDPKFYPLEAVYGAVYVFLDKAYVYLDGDPKKEIFVHLKGKKKLNKKEMEDLRGEFFNELLNYSLHHQIAKRNRRIREYIVGAALLGASSENLEETIKSKEQDWQKDPLGIAVPWEERYGKRSKERKKKR